MVKSRLVIYKSDRPYQADVYGVSVTFCGCGLTETPPFCSGRHIKTVHEKQDKIYVYDSKGVLLGPVKHIVLENGEIVKPEDIYMVSKATERE
ncbi:MAG: hypothetical protein F7C32_00690 [Desulfurococcales archaeon]|nr:hypothetical protein [Desulfurococcales archaeon]